MLKIQVCIVQKRDSGRLFAMKYVSRSVLDGRGALGGVIKEVELLSSLEHPFLVNLWFSFQGNNFILSCISLTFSISPFLHFSLSPLSSLSSLFLPSLFYSIHQQHLNNLAQLYTITVFAHSQYRVYIAPSICFKVESSVVSLETVVCNVHVFRSSNVYNP